MKTGHCKQHCRKYDKCQRPNKCYVEYELKRLENGRKRQVEIVSESELDGPQMALWMNTAYGAYSDPKE